jgi:hypothetical protein
VTNETVDPPGQSQFPDSKSLDEPIRNFMDANSSASSRLEGQQAQHDSISAVNVVKAGYDSSIAHSSSSQIIDTHGTQFSAQVSYVPDCEYISRQMPHHFDVIHSIHRSTISNHASSQLECVGAHVWHIMSRVVQGSFQHQHALVQVLSPRS